ncbi:MAG: tRNA (adenosine(37)-N6)-dimethylallyltransferase MiaA [Bacteroidaceae bacterium]|nr:tRNA (adenosine(37)-N6)-dimethylallyltransferase MiaA [Bacteroidaceae bacterium]
MASYDKELVVILGPTAVGKTKLALEKAEEWGCPIIGCDSRQIYKGMSIGTAAPTPEELARVKHYMVGVLELEDYYSAARYEEDVIKLLDELFKSHRRVILSGGSMMYIDAVCNGIDDIPTIDDEVRDTLKQRLATEGLSPLLAELRLLDPEHYNRVDHRNTRRVVHALEVCYTSGKPYSSFLVAGKKERPFKITKIGLRRERDDLFKRINKRVDMMMEQGFMEEAKRLYPYRHLNSLNTVGYKELFQVISGEWPLEMAVERIKKNTRVYAKKQMTWFNKDAEIAWTNLTT